MNERKNESGGLITKVRLSNFCLCRAMWGGNFIVFSMEKKQAFFENRNHKWIHFYGFRYINSFWLFFPLSHFFCLFLIASKSAFLLLTGGLIADHAEFHNRMRIGLGKKKVFCFLQALGISMKRKRRKHILISSSFSSFIYLLKVNSGLPLFPVNFTLFQVCCFYGFLFGIVFEMTFSCHLKNKGRKFSRK